MAESSITQKTSESKFLDPVLFPPNRGFEYKVGTKLDAQDELKKWSDSSKMLLLQFFPETK